MTGRWGGVKWVVLATAMLLLAAAAAVPAWNAVEVDRQLHAMVTRYADTGDVQLRHLVHHRGWLTSSGSLEVVLRDGCAPSADGAPTAVVELRYGFSHVPDRQGPSTFAWQARTRWPDAPASTDATASSPQTAEVHGQGRVTWSASLQSSLALPALTLHRAGASLQAPASQGTLALDDQHLQFNWHLSDARLRSGRTHARLQGLTLDLDLSARDAGSGDIRLALDALNSGPLSARGWQLTTRIGQDGERLQAAIAQRLGQLTWGERTWRNLVLDTSVQGLHATALRRITDVVGQSCGVTHFTDDERMRFKQALLDLMAAGWRMQLDHLHGEGLPGQIDGNATLALPAGTSNEPGRLQLAQRLTATGRLTVQGQLISPEFHASALASGYFQGSAQALASSFDYHAGQMRIAGQPRDGRSIQQALSLLDAALSALLSPHPPHDDLPDYPEGEPPQALPDEPAMADTPPNPSLR